MAHTSGRFFLLVCRCRVVFLRRYVCFCCFVFIFFAFIEGAALHSTVLRYACMRPGGQTQLLIPYNCLCPLLFCFFSILERCRFFRVCCTITVSSLSYGEYVVRFSLPNGVFAPRDHGLNFYISLLCENSIN